MDPKHLMTYSDNQSDTSSGFDQDSQLFAMILPVFKLFQKILPKKSKVLQIFVRNLQNFLDKPLINVKQLL